MGKMILEIDRPGAGSPEYRTIENDPVSIGRGFDNDLVISDPYLDARHVRLRSSEQGWICEDLGGINGTFLVRYRQNGDKVRVNEPVPLGSGDSLIVGKTTIRLLDPGHPVEPARPMPVAQRPPLFSYQERPGFKLVLTLVLFYLVFYLVFYHTADRKEVSALIILAQETAMLVCLLAWSGMWAVITRFSRHQHRLSHHLLFSCHWSIMNYLVGIVLQYLLFFTCSHALGAFLAFLVFGFLGIFILNMHLAIATHMAVWKRRLIAGSIIFFIIGLCGLFYFGSRDEYESEPPHFISLVPAPDFLIPTTSISDEMKRLDKVFSK